MKRQVISRYQHDKFSDWSTPVQCCVWILSVLGPASLVLGVVLLGVAVRDPSATTVKAYNSAVGAWTEAGGGFELWKEAFDGPTLPMILTAVINNGTTAVSTETFDLYSEEGDVLLTHEGDGYDTYDATLFYAGVLPLGTGMGNSSEYMVATAYEPQQAVTFPTYSCGSTTITELCSAIPPPPPPAPPPAPRALAEAVGAFYEANVTKMKPGEIVAASAGGGGSDVSARRLRKLLAAPAMAAAASAAPAGPMCTVYYRQMKFLSMITMTATPPTSCGGGYCENTTWVYGQAPECGSVYQTVTIPIDAQTYAADVATGSEWCSNWPELFTAPRAGITLRSAADPYLVAGQLTNCSYTFKSAGEAYANAGFFFIIPGMAVSLIAFFCLEGMCSPRAFAGAFGGANGGSAAGGIAAVQQRAAAALGATVSGDGSGSTAPLGAYSAPNYGAISDVELRTPGGGAWAPH